MSSHHGRVGSGKGKERESSFGDREDLLLFGKELPKALDVLGQGMDETLLNGECRVVVIGVAGWSPGWCLPLLLSRLFFERIRRAGEFLTYLFIHSFRRCDKDHCGWSKYLFYRIILHPVPRRCSFISFLGLV